MSLDSTVGGETANSYVSLDYATNYFDNSPKASQWDAVVEQESALIYATTLLDTLVNWVGVQATSTQSLDWPRVVSGLSEYDDIIPVDIKRATCELAIDVANDPNTVYDDSLDMVQVGPIEVDFNEEASKTLLPQLVIGMLSNFGTVVPYSGSGIMTPTLVRV